ncbi:MAG: arginine--tRNA ligase, partial [Actinomycetota bacterium]|nr:arginine--tRNA ligase [Actinomycetota bacterium]
RVPPGTLAAVIRDELLTAVQAALSSLGVERVPDSVAVERPANREHGDWSTNAALVCSKIAGRNPRELGQALIDHLTDHRLPHVESLEIAGPGFVNFRLANTWLHDVLVAVIDQGEAEFGRSSMGAGQRVNVEFVSANPTGPLHAGHGRWAAYGDSLCRLLVRCGYAPHAETYVNDRGVQIGLFGRSLAARKAGEEPPADGYLGEYITEWASEMPDGADPAEWGLQRALDDQRRALESMHVHFDTWSSERASVEAGYMDSALERLRTAGHIFQEGGATWLRTTTFGDDKDRVLIKSDGEPTYLLPDIGYHESKYERGERIIDILGADHHGYTPRMRAALVGLGHPADSYEVIIGQNVKLLRDGQELKLSKRAGTMIEIGELIDDVGPDVARFAYLLQSIDTSQTIDIDVLRAQASENPVFYVQYAHARVHSIGREAAKRNITRGALDQTDLGALGHERELELLRVLSTLPEITELACNDRAPHKMANWVRELAAAFHGFYRDCPILRDDVEPATAQARLWLVEATRIGLSIGLDLLGVNAPEEM